MKKKHSKSRSIFIYPYKMGLFILPCETLSFETGKVLTVEIKRSKRKNEPLQPR